MKRTTFTASLVGSAAAGLIAAAIATPAFAQATTYPEGTDCSAIQNSQNRQDCMTQMNESRQNTTPGQELPQTPGTGTGTGTTGPGGAAGAAPAAPTAPGGTTGGGATGTGGAGGATGGGTTTP
jgi:hypothetical protein